MSIKIRDEHSRRPKRVVVKLGSLTITDPDGGINKSKLTAIVRDITELKNMGISPILVTSGAINAGKLVIDSSAKDIINLQSLSSVGQPILFNEFSKRFSKRNINTAQLLLTHDDFKNRTRYLNIRNLINNLINKDIIPILNENDAVTFEEITLGDNDQLAAMTSELIDADLLVLVSSTDGLYNKDPKEKDAKKIKLVAFDENFKGLKILTKSSAGRGGMKTKLEAVRRLTPLGVPVIIASNIGKNPIMRILTSSVGTYFKAGKRVTDTKRKAWISSTNRPNSAIHIDKGAFDALKKNASLLPVGVKKTVGQFGRGDSISVIYNRQIIGTGLSEYSSKEINLIQGKKSSELNSLLDNVTSKVIIHKNNMILKI